VLSFLANGAAVGQVGVTANVLCNIPGNRFANDDFLGARCRAPAQRCWLRYSVEATLQISKNQDVSLPVPSIRPLYLIVKKELFPFTNLVEFMATALPELIIVVFGLEAHFTGLLNSFVLDLKSTVSEECPICQGASADKIRWGFCTRFTCSYVARQ